MKKTLHKKTYHPTISKSIVSSSDSSTSSDSESSASSDGESEKTAKMEISTTTPVVAMKEDPSKNPPKTPPKPPSLQQVEETLQVNESKPEEDAKVNGLDQAQHKEHVAILDKLSASMKDDINTALDLINTSVNQIAHARWIMVNVKNTLDESYLECPVCQTKGDIPQRNSNDERIPKGRQTARTEESKDKDTSENRSIVPTSREEAGNSHNLNNEEGDKPLDKLIQPMGRSGYTLSKELTKYKGKTTSPQSSKIDKIRVSVPVSSSSKRLGSTSTPRSTPAPDNLGHAPSPVRTPKNKPGPKSSKVHPIQENAIKSAQGPASYKAGPRSKTRPLEKPLESSEADATKTIRAKKMANAPNLTQTQMNAIRELIKTGSKVHINLADISVHLNGERFVKDWTKVQLGIHQSVKGESRVNNSKSKQSSIRGDHSDLDEETTLCNLKRKNSDAAHNPSKKHKSSSHSSAKEHRKHSTEKENAEKERNSKSKSTHSSRDREKSRRKSIDSHSSSKGRKSPDRASSCASSKHCKSVSSDVKPSSKKSVPESNKKGIEDSDSKPAVVNKTATPPQQNSDLLPSTSEKPVDTLVPPTSTVTNPQIAQNKPIDPIAVKAAALQNKEAILKLLKDKFSSFKSLKAKEVPSRSVASTTAQEEEPSSNSASATSGEVTLKIDKLPGEQAIPTDTQEEVTNDVIEPDQMSETRVTTTQDEEIMTPAPMDDSSEKQRDPAGPIDSELLSAPVIANSTDVVVDSDEPMTEDTTSIALPSSSVPEPNLPLDDPIEMQDSAFNRLLSLLDE